MSEDVQTLINGAIDCHMHGSPDVTERIASDLELARAAKDAGMKGILVKSHVSPTASRARLVQDAVGGDFHVFGGLVLNRQAGGLNVAAVEAEIKLGARQIWLPTLSAVNQARISNRDLSQSVAVFDDDGHLQPQLYDIFDLIAQADIVLGTGHLSAAEIAKVVPIAMQRGVKKILITHPESRLIKMPLEMQNQLAKMGVFFERCFFQMSVKGAAAFPPQAMVEQIEKTGHSCCIISTDFGQISNDPPVEGLRKYMQILLEHGVSYAALEIMVKKNPAFLMGLSES